MSVPNTLHPPQLQSADALEKARRPIAYGDMDRNARLKRLRFRAWHRGTREADLLIGAYFDRHHDGWSEAEIGWFEQLLEEQDVDILAWAFGTAAPPERLAGDMMLRLKQLNYVKTPDDNDRP